MADAIVRDDPVLDLVAGNTPVPTDSNRVPDKAMSVPSRPVAIAVALGCAAILFAYCIAGSVRIEAGTRSGVRYRVETIWSDYAGYLTRQGASSDLVAVVAALVVLAVIGSCLLIGLALAIHDDDPRAE